MRVDGPIRDLRRLLYCGEWIESHVLHIYLLHAPDFLGYPDAIHLARDRPEVVKRGLRLKQVGNRLMELLGGREIHPINVRIGGFYRAPSREELLAFRPQIVEALDLAEATTRFAAGLPFPDREEEYDFVSLRHPDEYPMNDGEVVSSSGLRLPVDRYESEFEEHQVPYSTALHSVRRGGGPYLVGPLARFALNQDRLTPRARALAREAGLLGPVRNP
ncbi:nickel-dependent hydrogenase, large subunit, partial [mine drainage metagenome]